jgi:hypothetical protein
MVTDIHQNESAMSGMQFRFVIVFPKYPNSAMSAMDLLASHML